MYARCVLHSADMFVLSSQPDAKRMRAEENLVNPEMWQQRYPVCGASCTYENLMCVQGPVPLQISVPNEADKSEWNFNGQTFTVSLALSVSVAELKDALSARLGMLHRWCGKGD